MRATTIDQIIEELRSVTDRAERDASRIGYFSALYTRMTAALARGIRAGQFQDGERMERFSIAFGELYLGALAKQLAGKDAPAVWRGAFEAYESPGSCLLQHIYLGMNAHLLLDLPLAAVAVCSSGDLASLRADYFTINDVVRIELDGFHDDLCAVSPRLALVRRAGGALWARGSLAVLRAARLLAWRRAVTLARTPPTKRSLMIERYDRSAAEIGVRIARPGPGIRAIFQFLREREHDDVRLVIRTLRGCDP